MKCMLVESQNEETGLPTSLSPLGTVFPESVEKDFSKISLQEVGSSDVFS